MLRLIGSLTCCALKALPLAELGAGGFQHPLAQRPDQPGFLGHAQKLARLDLAEFRVKPARQRLEAQNSLVREAHHRLIKQLQLARFERRSQFGFDMQPPHGAGVQAAVKDPVGRTRPRLLAVLTFVHAQVGVAQHVAGFGVIGVAQRDTDTDAQAQLVGADLQRRVERLDQSAGQLLGVGSAAAQQHGEFVAAHAREQCPVGTLAASRLASSTSS